MVYLTRKLAEHIRHSLIGDMPPAVREIALRCVLDLLAAAFAGLHMPGPSAMRKVASQLFGEGGSPVWGTGKTAPPVAALLSNSAAASALDLDDGNRAARGHPGACVIPTALLMAERLQATADDLLSAIAIGYDVGVRIAAAQNTGAIKTRQSGRWAAFAAVAAAARLMKCNPEQISHALSIAGVLAPNQEANGSSGYSKLTGNDVKEGIPWSAATGLTALYLAKKGHTGPEDILDAGDYYDRERIMAGMGAHFEIVDTYFKPYSCCRYIHPALDGFLAIITRYSLKPEEIVAVDVETFDWALKLSNTTEPRNLVDVQYSLPYCLAIAAIDRRDAFAPLQPGVLNRPDLSQFANKVRLNVAADIDALFPAETLARVVVRTERRQLTSSIQPPYGDPKNPMLWDAIEDKFIRVAGAALSPERQREIVDGVLNLAAGDTATLLRSLR